MWGSLQPGFSLRGTSVPLERLAGTCGRRAEATPQAHLCPHLFPMAYTDEFRGFRGHIFVQTGPAGGAAEVCPNSPSSPREKSSRLTNNQSFSSTCRQSCVQTQEGRNHARPHGLAFSTSSKKT